jgi:hypothetical protein
MSALSWTTRLEIELSGSTALRVLDKKSIVRVARDVQPKIWLRPGAIVSLQTVLGDAGIWNNFTDWVTAVVPISRRYTTQSLGRLETSGGVFVFRGLPESILEAGRDEDRLVANVSYRRATPEAALLHWLYLSNSPRSRMSTPPLDLDLELLNRQKLKRLAGAMGLSELLNSFLPRVGTNDSTA